MKRSDRKVVAALTFDGNSYSDLLYPSLAARGWTVVPADLSGRWILRHAAQLSHCHVQWPSFHYYRPGARLSKRLLWLGRFIVLLILLRLRGVRIVWTAHNLYPHDGGREVLEHRIARRVVVRLSSAIFVHGPTAEKIVHEEFPASRGKTHQTSHGHWIGFYPDEISGESARRRLGLREGEFVYLFVGTCKEYKNLELLIDAFGSLPRTASRLVIAGSFQSDAYLRKIRELAEPFGERILLHPEFIPSAELQVFLRAADAVVLPYKEILTSGTAVLAMSFGKPVIAPAQGALLDLVNPAVGILFSSDSERSLANAMLEATSRRFDSQRILSHARSFSWEHAAESFDAVLT